MSINKLALIRYKTIDECLQNRFRKWTLDDLIEKVGDALYEFEGILDGVSKRTIQADIQLMRSDKLGYNAPIVVHEKKYYAYEDPKYSITKTPINNTDIQKMKEIVSVLKQMEGFNYFDALSEMIVKLESSLHKTTQQAYNYIQFETNALLKGIKHLNPLYQAILKKTPLLLTYQSFKAREASQLIYYPYLLKEYRNRWFLIANMKDGKYLHTLALDRIEAFSLLPKEPFVAHQGIDFDRYYQDLIGVTKNERERGRKVIFWVEKRHVPYILTKPIHRSQQLLTEDTLGATLRIDVVFNFELERELLGFGESIRVIAPESLRKQIQGRLRTALTQYEEEENKNKEE
jgi:predicted DNA-binding transcriptional regulator YafY